MIDSKPRTCKPLTGFCLPCPMCGSEEADITVCLAGLSKDGSDDEFHCRECDNYFGRAFIHILVSRWAKVIDWVEQVPQLKSEE